MFNLSGTELIFLVLIALVVLGPDKLPEAMRKAGKAYADFKRMTTGFQSEMKSVLDEPMRELRETAELAKKSAMFDINGMTAEKPVSGSMAAQTPVRAAARPRPPTTQLAEVSTEPSPAVEPTVEPTVEAALAQLEVKNEPVARATIPASGPPGAATVDVTSVDATSVDATSVDLRTVAADSDSEESASTVGEVPA